MVNSRQKGARGELEAAKALVRAMPWLTARRGQQFRGGPDSPDVVVSLSGVHIEVKRTECLRLYEAMDQADDDKAAGEIGVVLHKRNLKPWVAIVQLDELATLARIIEQSRMESMR